MKRQQQEKQRQALKKLQNLFSWNEFYTKLGMYNKEAAEQVQAEIQEHKKKHKLYG